MVGAPGSAGRRRELREFLVERRAAVTPAQVGLPDGGPRRRTAGLRREEVAVLAGVGPSWYQWLEQGRTITVSPQVLDAIARVLRLDDAERRHLYVLADLNPPQPGSPSDPALRAGLQRLVDAWSPSPAVIMDAYWNVVGHNEPARLVFGPEGVDVNCLRMYFTDPLYRTRGDGWRRNAEDLVAQFRAATAERPHDDGYRAVVEDIATASPEFAELWSRTRVMAGGQIANRLDHPVVGTLEFETTRLRVPGRHDVTISLLNPVAGTDTAARLDRLLRERRNDP
ncbi:helix-turn-helix transcriptional regulator [Umezawaea sp. NPDC059074]|uniref:helix-turn-helix transcriptional regulator n=1 Tax=Umezawaea sp. NPDC059074 TaxID=3346716 RepID=UPI0036960D00